MLATRFQRKLIYQTLNWKWVSTSYNGGDGVGFAAKVYDLSHLDQVSKGPTRGNHRNTKSKTPHFCKYCWCAGERDIYASVVCMQKERFIQVSRVDEEERKRRKQQKLEREQVRTLQMCFCWRVCSLWFDGVSALNRRSWMMRWASPGSSTPFPSLYVQLAQPSLLSCYSFPVFSVLFLFYLFFSWHAGETCCRPQHAAGCDAHHPPVLLSSARGARWAGLLKLCRYCMENKQE